MTTALRQTGIEPVGEMPWGTHFCHFYETKDDLLETLLPFFKAGLEANEFCAWVVSEPLNEAEVWQALGRAVPDFDRYVSSHSIEVLNARDVYLAGGEIDLHRIIGNWSAKLEGALSRGYEGIRVTGHQLGIAAGGQVPPVLHGRPDQTSVVKASSGAQQQRMAPIGPQHVGGRVMQGGRVQPQGDRGPWSGLVDRPDFQQGIGGGAPHRTSPAKDVVFAVRFEPGALFFRLNHQTISTKNACPTQSSRDLLEKSDFPITIDQQLRFAVSALSLVLRALSWQRERRANRQRVGRDAA